LFFKLGSRFSILPPTLRLGEELVFETRQPERQMIEKMKLKLTTKDDL
jgi:hypothetical protein